MAFVLARKRLVVGSSNTIFQRKRLRELIMIALLRVGLALLVGCGTTCDDLVFRDISCH
jgi:energy-converting hydrogenase Eha subunit C